MTAPDRRPLAASTLAAYGFLGLPLSALGLPLFIHVPRYYADELNVGLATVGFVLLLARLWDCITDPAVGIASDRLATRYGRRKPWIVLGVPLLAVALWFLFVPPAGAGWLYLLIWSMLVYLAWTMVMLPYQSWGAELSTDFNERTRVTGAREAAIIAGTLAAAGAAFLFDGDTGRTLLALAVLTAIFLPLAAVVAVLWVPDTVNPVGPGVDWRQGLALMRDNAPFRRLLLAYGLNGVANGLPATLILLFVDDYLGLAGQGGLFLLCYFLFAIAGVPVWVMLSRRLGKHRAWTAGLLFNALCFSLVLFLRPGDAVFYFAICALTGLALGADLALPPSMQADVVDRDTAAGGGRRTGLYFALWSLVTKLSLALAVGIAFPLLELSGFAPGDGSDRGHWALLALYGPVPIVVKLGVAALIRGYTLDAQAHAQAAARIDAIAGGEER